MSERAIPGKAAALRPRVVAIDRLKAISIVAIVWIHAFIPDLFPPGHRLVYVAWGIALFAVPAFFFASGFLYQRDSPIPWLLTRRRLIRLLVPYLLASLAGEAFNFAVTSHAPGAMRLLFNLATGNSLGIYYFVPILMVMILVSLVLSRLPRLLIPLLLLSVVLGLLNATQSFFYGENFFWTLRDPFRWSGYFIFGWIVRRHWSVITGLSPAALRGAVSFLVLAILLYVVYLFGQEKHAWSAGIGAAGYLNNYLVISAISLLAIRAPALEFVRWLSDRSYTVYLYHFFFLFPVLHWFVQRPALAPFAAWTAGVGGGVLLALWARRLLGPGRARLLLGA